MKLMPILPVVVSVALLVGVVPLRTLLQEWREQIVPAESIDATSHTILPLALGGFRGIAADILWLRLTALQDEGSHVEILQLANWITALIPHAPEVWSYQAWNMTFNISAVMSDPPERWAWVQRGISLLIHDARRRSPQPSRIDWEIGNIYQHKIASTFDRTHPYYQWRLARQVDAFLPGGRLPPDWPGPSGLPAAARELGLNPIVMRQLDRLYGPLDWRLASTHALYWATRCLETASGRFRLHAERMIYQSLVNQFRKGLITLGPDEGNITTRPDLSRFEVCRRAYESAIERFNADDTKESFAGFLRKAVTFFHSADRRNEAEQAFALLRSRFPEKAVETPYADLITDEVE